MNGIHDMGGMHGMGPIEHEQNEPVFHEEWEGRVYAITRLLRAGGGRQNLDNSRYLIELLPPADYLRMSYYEKWLARLLKQIVDLGVVTAAELESGQPSPGSPKATPGVPAATVPAMVVRRNSARRSAFRRIWARSCARPRVRLCSTRRGPSTRSLQRPNRR